ncbi:MAG: ArsR/SmtB family transcription factor, partial [Chloroflexota bacterium]
MKTLSRDQTAAEARAVRMMRALASPVRFHLVEILAERKDCTASRLAQALSLAQSSLSEHLGALRDAGLVQTSGESAAATSRYYCLDPGAVDFLAAYLAGLGQR